MNKILEIQKEMPKIGKDGDNPYFSSSYLTLGKLLDKVLPIMQKHNVLLLQTPSAVITDSNLFGTLKTEMIDGETDDLLFSSEMLLATKSQDPQAQGSAITYARRYALMTILGIVPAETDDDGNKSSPAPIERSMNKTQWGALGTLLDEKGISSRDDKITLIRALAGDQPLNTSAYARLEKEIKEAMSDTLQQIILDEE